MTNKHSELPLFLPCTSSGQWRERLAQSRQRSHQIVANGFFRSNARTKPILLEAVEAVLYVDEKATVFLTSSQAEQTATSTSDVDVLILCSARPSVSEIDFVKHHYILASRGWKSAREGFGVDEEIFKIVDYSDDGHLQIQAAYQTYNDIFRSIQRVDNFFLHSLNTTVDTGLELDYGTLQLLHRILVGIPIREARECTDLLLEFDLWKYLYCLFRHSSSGYPAFKDVMGHYHDEDFESAMLAMHDYLTRELMALTHLLGNTNSNEKWLLTILRRFPSEYVDVRMEAESLLTFANFSSPEKYVVSACQFSRQGWNC